MKVFLKFLLFLSIVSMVVIGFSSFFVNRAFTGFLALQTLICLVILTISD